MYKRFEIKDRENIEEMNHLAMNCTGGNGLFSRINSIFAQPKSKGYQMRKAVIDLGTNTFHLFIVEDEKEGLKTLYKEKIAVKIGQNGISKGRIAADAIKRALHTLNIFHTLIQQFEVKQVFGVATSAIRNAKNGQELLDRIFETTGIQIQMISGDREAELIYEGVLATQSLSEAKSLIMDIGGGSVEFIIGNKNEIFWKKSFEFGAQRLLDRFHHEDPMKAKSIAALKNYLQESTRELQEALHQHRPEHLIGCSGTFDTLTEIHYQQIEEERPGTQKIFKMPIAEYLQIHQALLSKNREERLAIPGMVSMRVDMIVVASCLIQFITEHLPLENIYCCTYALKEGIVHSMKQQSMLTSS